MTFEDYYNQAENQYIKRYYKKALFYFQEAYKLKETNDCLNYIGCCYLELNNFKAAGEVFFKLSDNNPEWERPVFNLGRVFLRSGYIEEALTAFKEAERRNPNNEDVYFYLGAYYYKIKDYITAKDYYQKSISLNYEQSEAHLNLGKCYYHLGMNNEAINEFELALKYDSNCLEAIYNKGIVLSAMNQYNRALDDLFYINNLQPNDLEVMENIVDALYKSNDLTNATVWVNKILKIEPHNSLANKLLEGMEGIKQ